MKRIFGVMPSPGFVLAFIALCVALGGTATALEGIDSVTKNDIRRGAVGKSEVRVDSIGKSELIEDVVTGGQVLEPTLQNVGTAQGLTHWAVVRSNGERARSRNVTTTVRTGEGSYNVVFNRSVQNCAYIASLGQVSTGGGQAGQVSSTLLSGINNVVRVRTRNSNGGSADRDFHIALTC